MAEFSKTLKAPSVSTQTPQLQTSGKSLAMDLVAAGEFAFDLYAQNVQREQQAQQQKILTEQSMEFNSGASLAQQHLTKLSQLSGTKQSIKKRQLQQQALSQLSTQGLEGYLEVTKESGLGLAVVEEQALANDLREQQATEEQNLIQEGRELVVASASDDSEDMQKLYQKFGEDGWTSEELMQLASINRGKRRIADRRASELNRERAALGLKQDNLSQTTQAKVNEEIIGISNSLQVPAILMNKTLASQNPQDVVTAKEGLKVQANKQLTRFQKFLQSLSPEEKASIDITAVNSQFSSMVNQVIGIADKVDPAKTNKDLTALLMDSTLAAWVHKGSTAQKTVAYSLLMGVSPDPAIAQMAVNREGADLSGNNPMAVDIVNRLTGAISGQVDPRDEVTPRLVEKSKASPSEKAEVLGPYAVAGAYENVPVHNPAIFKSYLRIQEEVAADVEAVGVVRSLLEEKGHDPFETIRDQHSITLEKSVWPSLVSAGYEQGNVRFEVTESGLRAVRNKGNRPVNEPGNVKDERVQKALRQATNLVNRMAKTAAKIGGFSEKDAYMTYAELLNGLNGTIEIEEDEQNGENTEQE